MGLSTIPTGDRRTYVQEHLTVVHDEIPSHFVVSEIKEYLDEEELWDAKDLDRLITHLHGFHQFRNARREKRLRIRAGEEPPPY